MAKLFAISDLHVDHDENRAVVEALPAQPDDWLIIAGDVGHTIAHLDFVFSTLGPRFARLLWVPGNHDLWSIDDDVARGEAKYAELIAKAWADSSFLEDLKEDPASCLRDLGIHVPEGHSVQVHVNNDKASHIVIPVKPSGLLVEDQFHKDIAFFYSTDGATSDGCY